MLHIFQQSDTSPLCEMKLSLLLLVVKGLLLNILNILGCYIGDMRAGKCRPETQTYARYLVTASDKQTQEMVITLESEIWKRWAIRRASTLSPFYFLCVCNFSLSVRKGHVSARLYAILWNVKGLNRYQGLRRWRLFSPYNLGLFAGFARQLDSFPTCILYRCERCIKRKINIFGPFWQQSDMRLRYCPRLHRRDGSWSRGIHLSHYLLKRLGWTNRGWSQRSM